MQRRLIVITALTTLVAACGEHTVPSALDDPSAAVVGPSLAQNANPKRPGTTVIVYDDFHKPGGYTLADYNAKWSILALGEMAIEDTRQFDNHTLSLSATPFRTAHDSSVADHTKYAALSKQVFAVPEIGSITVSMDIAAETPGTVQGHVVHGTYVRSGAPYAARVLQGQQAAATLHMIDFATGQLFDWFVSGNTAFPLFERLPSSVSGSASHVSTDKMYTQITHEVPIAAGVPHNVAIRYSRDRRRSRVEYLLDGKRVSKVERVGIPLDAQGVKYSGIYPSLGPGELLRDKINSVVIAHGLFSLLDAFPFQHPDAPALNVSVPMQERLFGQGARAKFANVVVTIEDRTTPSTENTLMTQNPNELTIDNSVLMPIDHQPWVALSVQSIDRGLLITNVAALAPSDVARAERVECTVDPQATGRALARFLCRR